MYLVLVVQFGSFLDPPRSCSRRRSSLIGVVGALMLTGDTLTSQSLIGVILDGHRREERDSAHRLREVVGGEGLLRREAIIEAGRARLRPILMTTFALIAGMVPVALGHGEGARLPRAARPRHHRRRDHVDVPDAARDPDVLRHSGGARDRTRRLFGRGKKDASLKLAS
jgi:hypothetical protein